MYLVRLILLISSLLFLISTSQSQAQAIKARLEHPWKTDYQKTYKRLAFSHDGKFLAAASSDSIYVWNIAMKKRIAHLKGHAGKVLCVSFSPDGKLLASGCVDGEIKLWDAKSFRYLKQLNQSRESKGTRWISDVVFSPDGNLLTTSSVNKKAYVVRLWDVKSGKRKSLNWFDDMVWSFAFNATGKTLILGGKDFRRMDVVTGDIGPAFGAEEGNDILKLTIDPQGEKLIAVRQKSIQEWDLRKRRPLCIRDAFSLPDSALSRDGKTLAVSEPTKLQFYDVGTGARIGKGLHGYINGPLAFSRDMKTLAVPQVDGILLVSNPNFPLARNAQKRIRFIRSVAFTPDSKTLASAGSDGVIRLRKLPSLEKIADINAHEKRCNAVTISPDGKTLASAGNDSTVKLWNAADGKLLDTFKNHTGIVTSVAFSPDGKTLASASHDKTIILRDKRGKSLRILKGHSSYVNAVTFSPDGKMLASAGTDHTVRLWDVRNGQLKQTIKGHGGSVLSVAFSADGKTLVSASSDRTVRLWNVATGKQIAILKGHSRAVNRVAVHPNGKTLASAGSDNRVILWNWKTGKRIKTLNWHKLPVTSLDFSPDGKFLASGGWDGTEVWDLAIHSFTPIQVRGDSP